MISKEEIKKMCGELLEHGYQSIEYKSMMKNMVGTAGVAAGSGFFVG